MIDIENLTVIKESLTICSVPKLAIAPGARVAILGANGSGKSTLLRVLIGVESEFEGKCSISAPRLERALVRQSPYLFRGTVMSNVTYGLRARSVARAKREILGTEWLKHLGLDKLANHPVTHLSGGERRRVALAQAMVLRPRLLLLDEPFADLDDSGAAAVVSAMEELQECTILVATPTSLPKGVASSEYQLNSDASLPEVSPTNP